MSLSEVKSARSYINQYVILTLFSLLFVGAYSQWALYTSNQNTYFLHGLAQAGVGYLKNDWLANTTDHLPVFTQIIFISHRYISPNIFYLYHGLLIGLYIFSLSVIISHTFKIRYNSLAFVMAFATLTFLHSFVIQALIAKIPLLARYSRLSNLFTYGLAGQYILGSYFQPSAFGVFLIGSMVLFLKKRAIWSVVSAFVAAIVHPSYLLHAMWLTMGYLVLLLREKGLSYAIRLGLLALLISLPNILYVLFNFSPTDPGDPSGSSGQAFQLAQSILVDKRIPHHAKVSYWFGTEALIQILICFLALFVAKRLPRFATILLVLFLGSLSLTLLQIITGSHTLALLFPWRVSVLLIPVSTALLIGYASTQLAKSLGRLSHRYQRAILIMTLLLITVMSLAGIAGTIINMQRSESHLALIEWAQKNTQQSDLFLIPPHDDEFRLHVGVPVFIDYKSHPYKDAEVVEWDHRVELANSFYYAKKHDAPYKHRKSCNALRRMINDYPITHLVIDKRTTGQCDELTESIEYEDQTYQIMKIRVKN